MKNPPDKEMDGPPKTKVKAPPKKSAAAEQLGGQPENDHDARAAGLESATADAPAKPTKSRSA